MPKIWSVLVSVSWAPERISNLLLLGGVFCKYSLYPAVEAAELFYILADFLSSHSVSCWGGVLKSPTVIVDLSVSLFHSISFCFTYIAALLFGA